MYILASGRGWWIFMSHPVYRERASWLRRSLPVPPHTPSPNVETRRQLLLIVASCQIKPHRLSSRRRRTMWARWVTARCVVCHAPSPVCTAITLMYIPSLSPGGPSPSDGGWDGEEVRTEAKVCGTEKDFVWGMEYAVIPHTFLSLAFNTNLICLTIKHVMIRSVWYWFQFVLVYVPLTGQAVLWFRWLHAS